MLAIPETNSGPNIHVLAANLIMPPQVSVLGTAEEYQEYGAAIGVDGFEINPIRSRYMWNVLRHAADLRRNGGEPGAYSKRNAAELTAIRSTAATVHETFRDEKVSKGFESIVGKVVGHLSPHREQGFKRINALQYLAGRSLHGVFFSRYLDEPASLDPARLPLMERSVQPKPFDWLGLWRLLEDAPISTIKATLVEHGFTSFTADGFHLQDGGVLSELNISNLGLQDAPGLIDGALKFRRPHKLLRRISAGGLVTAKHVSLNRLDCAPKGSKLAESTANANKAFMHSRERAAETLEGMMLLSVIRDWKRLPVHDGQDRYIVLERPPLGPKQALKRGEIQREQDEHQAIVRTIRELIIAA